MVKTILIDVMQDGRFLFQLRYSKRGFPKLVNGEIVETHNFRDIENFVYEQRPSLRGKKNVLITFSNQRVI